MRASAATIQARPALPLAGTCRAPLPREPITASQAAGPAQLLKALADPTRLRLVSMAAPHDGGDACARDLTEPPGLTQPAISHHPRILVQARDLHPRQARRLGLLLTRPPGPGRALRGAEHNPPGPKITRPGGWPLAQKTADDQSQSAGVRAGQAALVRPAARCRADQPSHAAELYWTAGSSLP